MGALPAAAARGGAGCGGAGGVRISPSGGGRAARRGARAARRAGAARVGAAGRAHRAAAHARRQRTAGRWRARRGGRRAAATPPPPPARSESNGYAIHWQRPVQRTADDGVEVVTEGWRHGVRLVVTSGGGMGQVEVRPTRGGWPNQVQVEFRYAPDRPFDALEGMRFQVINPAHTAGDEVPPLVPDNFVFWQRDGRFWLDLPNGWLRRQQTLRIAWVDFYRR
ncbi:hypothetical protein [Ottowia testudinis]|uniref:Uncharacterized protein n=1 Tax=Ottowia testudinis TaxID=2816950 RepID=A0A975CGN6_9BURK|nr:hypothetical protein [Ottowia testudinis]QTD45219.1 hypothetical protein J1M35_19740 [Ottowia testudinis]